MHNRKATLAVVIAAVTTAAVAVNGPSPAHAGGLVCRKVVAAAASGEGRNALEASRARCADDEMLTGGACYPEQRPEDDGSCQTSGMAIVQTLAENPGTTQGAFYTCLQTGGTDCAVEERTRAMAICCKIDADDDTKSEGADDEKPAAQ